MPSRGEGSIVLYASRSVNSLVILLISQTRISNCTGVNALCTILWAFTRVHCQLFPGFTFLLTVRNCKYGEHLRGMRGQNMNKSLSVLIDPPRRKSCALAHLLSVS